MNQYSIAARRLLLACALAVAGPAGADEAESTSPADPPTPSGVMDNARLGELLRAFDPEIKGTPGRWTIAFEGVPAHVVTDERADRMRIMIAVRPMDGLDQAQLLRLMQANFESALDARYAIAQGQLWSVFIHPLTPLSDAEVRAAIAQTFTLALTYGGAYSSGALVFGGGDHAGRDLHDELLRRGQRI